MFFERLNAKYKQTSHRNLLRLVVWTVVGIALSSLTGCSQKQIQQTNAANQPGNTVQSLRNSELRLMGDLYFDFSTVVRVRQIEVTRDTALGPDESSIHTPREARLFREAIDKD